MIISHTHRFIFFAVPRTGTHAVRAALTAHLGETDWQQQNLSAPLRLPIPALAEVEHGHLSVRELRPHLPRTVWDEYFKFAFVRNPFDRFVSACFFLHRGQANFAAAPTMQMKRALSRRRFRQRVLIRPQSRQLAGADGRVPLDYVGRFERLQDSYDRICTRIGIAPSRLAQRNASQHAAYARYYDPELKDMVADFYREDVDNFDYGFEPPPVTN
jgi:hypothetical protein